MKTEGTEQHQAKSPLFLNSLEIEKQIRACDIRGLSPKALSAMAGILGLNAVIKHECDISAILYETAVAHYDEATTWDEKAQWLKALYRMAGLFTSLIPTDCYLEDECDERFDDLMAKHGTQDDTLLCYRLHRNLISPAPYDQQLRSDFLEKCRQWTCELTETEPQMWFALPLSQRLHRLWLLCAIDYKAELHLNPKQFAPQRWQDIQTCFYRCQQQFQRIDQPDAETLTAYYWTLCQFYPDSNGTNPEAYEEFFLRFDRTLPTLQPGSDEWWQFMEIAEHHRKDTTKTYQRYSLPDLSILNSNSMCDFRTTYYRWEFQDTEYYDIQAERDIQSYAYECAERLLPSFDKNLKHQINLGKDAETTYLLTLLQALTLAELNDQKERLLPRIIDRLPQLPDTRYKTHLLAYLNLCGYNEFFTEALDAATAWDPQTLTEEDRYIQRYLCESFEFLQQCNLATA